MKADAKEIRPFFVYGTLLPKQPNYYLVEDAIVRQSPARFQGGRLYDMGHYPMMIPGGKTAVQGYFLEVDAQQYAQVLQRLDQLEGYFPAKPWQSDYQRQVSTVRLNNGRLANAWVYVGQPNQVKNKPLLPHGCWVTHIEQKMEQVITWWEDTKSVAGLHKVGL